MLPWQTCHRTVYPILQFPSAVGADGRRTRGLWQRYSYAVLDEHQMGWGIGNELAAAVEPSEDQMATVYVWTERCRSAHCVCTNHCCFYGANCRGVQTTLFTANLLRRRFLGSVSHLISFASETPLGEPVLFTSDEEDGVLVPDSKAHCGGLGDPSPLQVSEL